MFERELAHDMLLYTQGPTTAPEMTLVARIRTGDEEAFGEMHRMYAPMIHGIVLSRVPYDEVQDIVQDVFLTAYRKISSLRDENALGAWLARIARNRAVEYYRRPHATEELSETMHGRNDVSGEAVEIMQVLRGLPEAYRETLVLRLVEGMSGNEIAGATGLKPESVRVNLHRGMEMLRQRLGIKDRTK
jgi:RNA polymerase sigma-70 factor, ECF subfamily